MTKTNKVISQTPDFYLNTNMLVQKKSDSKRTILHMHQTICSNHLITGVQALTCLRMSDTGPETLKPKPFRNVTKL